MCCLERLWIGFCFLLSFLLPRNLFLLSLAGGLLPLLLGELLRLEQALPVLRLFQIGLFLRRLLLLLELLLGCCSSLGSEILKFLLLFRQALLSLLFFQYRLYFSLLHPTHVADK